MNARHDNYCMEDLGAIGDTLQKLKRDVSKHVSKRNASLLDGRPLTAEGRAHERSLASAIGRFASRVRRYRDSIPGPASHARRVKLNRILKNIEAVKNALHKEPSPQKVYQAMEARMRHATSSQERYRLAAELDRRSRADNRGVRTVSGGLPSLGKNHR